MGDIARFSLTGAETLYKTFGINAELLIDHAWGYEPTRIKDIKEYHTENNSISSGQVLSKPYPFEKGKLVMKEMADMLSLDLLDKRLVTDQIVLTVCYDNSSTNSYSGELAVDPYGRTVPKESHGSLNLECQTSSSDIITEAFVELFDKIVKPHLYIRRMYLVANHVVPEYSVIKEPAYEQMDLFTDYEELDKKRSQESEKRKKERKKQETILSIKKKYGKNSILKGIDYEEDATAKDRNSQVGGHNA